MNGLAPKKMDWGLHATLLLLIASSVSFIFSAQFQTLSSTGGIWIRQLIYAGLGLIGYLFMAWLDYRKWKRVISWLYPISIGLLLLVFLFPEINGAHRWIYLPGFSLQPSELAKPIMLIMLAAYICAPDRDLASYKTFFGCVAIIALPALLIAIEPDLSSALVALPAALVVLLYTGIQRRFLLISTVLLLLLALLICVWVTLERPASSTPPDEDVGFSLPTLPLLESYQKERIRVFLSDEYDTSGSGWSKLQAQVAVGSGGFYGKGFLKGTQNMLGFLPRTVAPTDFIFCVIAEESGFCGSMLILLLYLFLLYRCLRTAWRAPDEFGRMCALSITILLFCHVFINIAMTIGLLPITGLPLPLMSYGGSCMIATMGMLGLIQSIYQRRRIR